MRKIGPHSIIVILYIYRCFITSILLLLSRIPVYSPCLIPFSPYREPHFFNAGGTLNIFSYYLECSALTVIWPHFHLCCWAADCKLLRFQEHFSAIKHLNICMRIVQSRLFMIAYINVCFPCTCTVYFSCIPSQIILSIYCSPYCYPYASSSKQAYILRCYLVAGLISTWILQIQCHFRLAHITCTCHTTCHYSISSSDIYMCKIGPNRITMIFYIYYCLITSILLFLSCIPVYSPRLISSIPYREPHFFNTGGTLNIFSYYLKCSALTIIWPYFHLCCWTADRELQTINISFFSIIANSINIGRIRSTFFMITYFYIGCPTTI